MRLIQWEFYTPTEFNRIYPGLYGGQHRTKGGIVMPKTANINLRIDPDIKSQAEAVYSRLGISVTDAINVFLHASIMEGGFPFQPRQPRYNRETLLAMQEARDIMAGKVNARRYASLSALLKDIDAEESDA